MMKHSVLKRDGIMCMLDSRKFRYAFLISQVTAIAVAMLLFHPTSMRAHSLRARPTQTSSANSNEKQEFLDRLVAAAIERTHHFVRYDPSYVHIPYPGGDVPADRGVCTDVIIRAYRAVGVDLQKLVHEDMEQNFAAYPHIWHNSAPDTNIDHRRVPNLMVFFSRWGEKLPISGRAADYLPGDLVTWDLGGGVPHIGIVVDVKSPQSGRYMVVHNIGQGPKMEDVLFDWRITGHFRYLGPHL